MSTATTSSAPDLPAQWAAITDDEISLESVESLLKPIRDDLWVSAACVDRVLNDANVQRALLDLGIERTSAAAQRALNAAEHTGDASSEDDDVREEGEAERREQDAQDARLRERLMPKRRFSVGTGTRRRIGSDEGLYRYD